MRTFVSKGWGFEDFIVNKDLYCGKRLYICKDKILSWHRHVVKDETFYISSGKVILFWSYQECLNSSKTLFYVKMNSVLKKLEKTYRFPKICLPESLGHEAAHAEILSVGDEFHVPPGMLHAVFALKDSEIIEFSTTHMDEDSIRLVKGD